MTHEIDPLEEPFPAGAFGQAIAWVEALQYETRKLRRELLALDPKFDAEKIVESARDLGRLWALLTELQLGQYRIEDKATKIMNNFVKQESKIQSLEKRLYNMEHPTT